jgi:hypothetical protein
MHSGFAVMDKRLKTTYQASETQLAGERSQLQYVFNSGNWLERLEIWVNQYELVLG